jgi:anti-sigma factor RsiW
MTAINDKAPESDIDALLPWHAAGTLSAQEAEMVERALSSDPALAQRYALVQDELSETVHVNESLGAPSQRAMQKLFAAIDAEPARQPAHGGLGRISSFFASLSPRTLSWAASAAAVVLLVQSGLIADLVLREGQPLGQYQTASAPESSIPSAPESAAPSVSQNASPSTPLRAPTRSVLRGLAADAHALIRFAPQASIADINAFLEINRLSIVAGPAPGGLYTVRFADAAPSQDELDATIKKLQQNRLVDFAGAAK